MRSLAARNDATGTTNLRTHRFSTPKLESNPRDYQQPYTLRERIAIEAIDEQVISTPVGTARLNWYRAPPLRGRSRSAPG